MFNFIPKTLDYLGKAISETTDVSSKRLCGFLMVLFFIIVEIVAMAYLWQKELLQDHLFELTWPVVVLVGAFFALTLAEAPWNKTKGGDGQ